MTTLASGAEVPTAARPYEGAAGRVFGWLETALPIVWVLYALFNKAFAWVHVPGVQLFPGEVVLGLVLVAAVVGTGHFRLSARGPVAAILGALVVWGLIRTLPQITTYGIDAIRDAALWYYAFFAFAVMALVHRRPSLPEEWLHRYVRFLPWLLLWFPIAIVLDRVMAGGPWIPDSDVYVFTHKPADAAIHTAVALAVLWLFPTIVGSPRRRLVLMAMCVVVLCVALTQNRGGIVAAAAGLGVGWLFMAHRVRAALEVLAIVAVLLVFGWALDLRIAGERDVSVGQIMDNVLSLAGKPGDPKLEGTVEWRGELWDRVLQETIARDRLAFGWGFGPNLGDEGFGGAGGGLLRSPHNSHLNLLARMGILGSAMWMALWVAWGFAMYHARHTFERRRDDVGRGLVTVCMVGVTASIVNAYFDPALEGPHSSVLLWTLTGLGLALAAQAHGWGGRIRRPATVDATSQE